MWPPVGRAVQVDRSAAAATSAPPAGSPARRARRRRPPSTAAPAAARSARSRPAAGPGASRGSGAGPPRRRRRASRPRAAPAPGSARTGPGRSGATRRSLPPAPRSSASRTAAVAPIEEPISTTRSGGMPSLSMTPSRIRLDGALDEEVAVLALVIGPVGVGAERVAQEQEPPRRQRPEHPHAVEVALVQRAVAALLAPLAEERREVDAQDVGIPGVEHVVVEPVLDRHAVLVAGRAPRRGRTCHGAGAGLRRPPGCPRRGAGERAPRGAGDASARRPGRRAMVARVRSRPGGIGRGRIGQGCWYPPRRCPLRQRSRASTRGSCARAAFRCPASWATRPASRSTTA